MKKLKDVWDSLPTLDYTKKYVDEKSGLRMYEICGRKFQETAKLAYVLDCLKKIEAGYGNRVREAKENRNIDWKALSHAIRAAFQVKQLLTENTITFPLKDAPLLKQIKNGELDYMTVVAPLLEDLMDEVEELSKKSKLPEKANRKFWDQWLVETIERELFLSEGHYTVFV